MISSAKVKKSTSKTRRNEDGLREEGLSQTFT